MSYITSQVIYNLSEDNYTVLAAACAETPGKRRIENVVEIDGFYSNLMIFVRRKPEYNGAQWSRVWIGNILPDGKFEENNSVRRTYAEDYAIGCFINQILTGH